MRESFLIPRRAFDALIFDLDGVITRTTTVHAHSWKELFDEYLKQRSRREGSPLRPFDIESDYRDYVDGRPRYDGVEAFLESRGISLPWGDENDPPDRETICGLGNRKNELFLKRVRGEGVETFASSVRLVRDARALGLRTALVTSSRNGSAVLEAAGLTDLFDVRIDGNDLRALGLTGKPAPDLFLEAARRLQVPPQRAVVFEDAPSGVQAGKAGGFGLVVGVAREGTAETLKHSGADAVVADLAEIALGDAPHPASAQGSPQSRLKDELPRALDHVQEILAERDPGKVAVFLDYDGTLSPIVPRSEDAEITPQMRDAVRRLARVCPVAVISGRDRDDVRRRIGVDGITYAGSHGFDILGPGGRELDPAGAGPIREELEAAQADLERIASGVSGARIERKRYSVALHYRQVEEGDLEGLRTRVEEVLGYRPRLRLSHGKKVYDIQPDVAWDKGRALLWLLDLLAPGAERSIFPVYIGDDVTDEDAFRVVRGRGAGITVRGGPERTLADYLLEGTEEVHRFLEALSDALERRR